MIISLFLVNWRKPDEEAKEGDVTREWAEV